MEITDLPPTPLVLPAAGNIVHIPTQRWALERWEGEDPPELAIPWGRKPKFSVNGSRSCAELAIVDHLRGDGWRGVWVNAFRRELRSQWFPAPAVKTLAHAGAPAWAVEVFGRLGAANGGTLSGFFAEEGSSSVTARDQDVETAGTVARAVTRRSGRVPGPAGARRSARRPTFSAQAWLSETRSTT
jgi:hypothetical protein